MSHHHNEGQNYNLLTVGKSFGNAAKFKYIETKVTNENYTHKEIKGRLNSANAWYHSVQNLLSSASYFKM